MLRKFLFFFSKKKKNNQYLLLFRYPLFLNLENHCSNKQQILVARLLNDVFGCKIFLFILKINFILFLLASIYTADEAYSCSVWPSPEQLKGRILIRVYL